MLAEKWEQEDMELATAGISNPWDKYHSGCPRNWLRAWSPLVISEGWATKIAESVA